MFDKSLEQSQEIATLILDGLPMGLLFCDREGIIRFINHAYADLLAIAPETALGRNIVEIIPHSRAQTVMTNGVPELGELCQLRQAQPVIVNRLPVRNASGQVAGMISQAIFNDPEELQRLSTKIGHLGRKLSQYRRRFQASLAPQHTFESILGESEAILRLKRQAQSYARLDEPVLILGHTGAGKELFAHAIHAASPRCRGPMVCINCASIPRELFESELFGHEKGAFSGARVEGKIGQIELADGGSLFLDEIGDMPLEIQAKLLRVLETRTVCRLGAVEPKPVDFRLMAATNRNLPVMLKNGTFREDLYYRINTFVLEIPPLCERQADIMPMAHYVLRRMGFDSLRFAPETEAAMRKFSWPGNARQLRNAVVHAATMRKSDVLYPDDFPPETLPSLGSMPLSSAKGTLPGARACAEAEAIYNMLVICGCNVAQTARRLEISRATLYEKMRRHGINPRTIQKEKTVL